MTGTFHTEIQKAHRRHDIWICLLVSMIMVVWVGGVTPSATDELANAYSALFYSIPVINSIVMPVFMALQVSRLWDMEIKGNTTKLLYTLQSRRSLFKGKMIFGVMEIFLTVFMEMGAVLLLGKIHGYTEAFPAGQFLYLTVCTTAVGLMLFLSEFFIMLIWNFPLPALFVGIVGAFLGLFSAFMPPIVSYFVPWGYFIPLSSYEVAKWDQATHTVTYGTRSFNWGLLAFTFVLAVLFFYASWCRVQKQEV